MHCKQCGLEFLYPQPTWEEIQKIYSSDYYASWDMKTSENEITAHLRSPVERVGALCAVGANSGYRNSYRVLP